MSGDRQSTSTEHSPQLFIDCREPETTRPALDASVHSLDRRAPCDLSLCANKSECKADGSDVKERASTSVEMVAAAHLPSPSLPHQDDQPPKSVHSGPPTSARDDLKPAPQSEQNGAASDSIDTDDLTKPRLPEPVSFIRTPDGLFVPVYDQQQLVMASQTRFGDEPNADSPVSNHGVSERKAQLPRRNLPYRRPVVVQTSRANLVAKLEHMSLSESPVTDTIASAASSVSTPQTANPTLGAFTPSYTLPALPFGTTESFGMGPSGPHSAVDLSTIADGMPAPLPIFDPMPLGDQQALSTHAYQYVPYPANTQQWSSSWSSPPPSFEPSTFVTTHHGLPGGPSGMPFSPPFHDPPSTPSAHRLPLAHRPLPHFHASPRRQQSLNF